MIFSLSYVFSKVESGKLTVNMITFYNKKTLQLISNSKAPFSCEIL